MFFLGKLHQAKAELAERGANPWRRTLERVLPADVTCISTVALLDLLGLAPTTGNARRIAPTMRSMGFIGLKSRRLMPGGFRDTVTRGWARPLREKTVGNEGGALSSAGMQNTFTTQGGRNE